MRLKVEELVLLELVVNKLRYLDDDELAERLETVVIRLKGRQAVEREGCRQRAAKNRQAGYVWNSSIHPQNSKWYDDDDKEKKEE